MDKLQIEGGVPLNGKIRISGAKNAALPIIAASLLTEEPVNISNSPHLHDVTTMIELLACLGVDVTLNEFMEVEIAARHLENYRAPYELVKTMKSAEKLSKIPVIALTSFTEEESREKALEAGFDGYAIKTNKENILRAVERFLVEE